jgi:hypothetical protein
MLWENAATSRRMPTIFKPFIQTNTLQAFRLQLHITRRWEHIWRTPDSMQTILVKYWHVSVNHPWNIITNRPLMWNCKNIYPSVSCIRLWCCSRPTLVVFSHVNRIKSFRSQSGAFFYSSFILIYSSMCFVHFSAWRTTRTIRTYLQRLHYANHAKLR